VVREPSIIVLREQIMSVKLSTENEKMKYRKMVLDPGNIMLLAYTLIVALVIICGGFLQAEAAELPTERAGSLIRTVSDRMNC
jgi:hypothetical protein